MTSPSDISSIGELQVDEDLRFQERMWTVQRVGWAVLTLIVVAAVLGFTGDGPLSESTARASEDLEVRYGRVERHRSPSTLVVSVSTAVAQERFVEIWVDRDFADRLRVQSITPEPDSVKTSATRVTYTFEVDDDEPRARITYDVLHQGLGLHRGHVGLATGPSVSFRQLVLP